MSWNNQSDDYLEAEVDLDSGEVTPLKEKKKKYPNKDAVYSIFKDVLKKKIPENWKINKYQCQAAENLYTERGLSQIKKALLLFKERKDEEYCPQVGTPYDLDSKWSKLHKFAQK